MMTNEQILKLAKSCGFDVSIGKEENFWECWEDQLIDFAQQIRRNTLQELKEWLPESTEDKNSWTYTPEYYIGQGDYKQFLIDNLK